MKPTYYDKSYKAAMSKENAAKNAVQNILPRKSQDINSLSVMILIIIFIWNFLQCNSMHSVFFSLLYLYYTCEQFISG